jgi:hypothetical protein
MEVILGRESIKKLKRVVLIILRKPSGILLLMVRVFGSCPPGGYPIFKAYTKYRTLPHDFT